MSASNDEQAMRVVAHVGSAVVAVLLVGGGVASAMSELTPVLAAGLLLLGAAGLALAYASWKGSRAGWAFAVALDGVVAVCNLFGATKIEDLAHVPLGVALVPCLVAAASCVLLASFHADYDH